MDSASFSVLLIDDHEVVRSGCQRLLHQNGHFRVVGEASSGEQGLELYRKLSPDVVVMDLSLPGMGGMETTRQILARDPAAKVIIFSIQNNEVLTERVMQTGAKGYVTKASDSAVLLEAVEQVAHNKSFLGSDVAQALALKRIHQQDSLFGDLSAREFEVFQLAARGLASASIAETLHLSPKTVSNYLHRIKQKLGVSTTAEMAHLAIRHGLLGS